MNNLGNARRSSFQAVAAWAALVALAPIAQAQQPNTSSAALSINGTGKVTSSGIVTTNSQRLPVPSGGAPLYWHRAQARSAIGFRVQGAVGAPVILAAGLPGPPLNLGPGIGLLELGMPLYLVVNGTDPSNIFNLSAFVGSSGSWTLVLGQGLPVLTPLHFQAAIFDPSAPSGVRLTGSITLELRNDLETLIRNLGDAYNQSLDEPGYGPSLCVPTFLWSGRNASAFFANPMNEPVVIRSVLPNATNAPPLPTGAPAPGQSITFAIEGEDVLPEAVAGIASVDRWRTYDLLARESLGAWKLNGDQRDASVEASVSFATFPPAPQQTVIEFHVWNDGTLPKRVTSVTLQGPQLAGLSSFPLPMTAAISSAPGTITVPVVPGMEPQGVDWSFHLGVGSSGTSRQPLVENPSGPRDVYQVTIHWDDNTTSGPYMLALRAALDAAIVPAAVTAAIPGLGTPTAVLTNGGMPNANLAVTFQVGAAPGAGAWSAVQFRIWQNGRVWQFDGLQLNPAPVIQTLNLSVPGLQSGATQVTFERRDLFSAYYRRYLSATL